MSVVASALGAAGGGNGGGHPPPGRQAPPFRRPGQASVATCSWRAAGAAGQSPRVCAQAAGSADPQAHRLAGIAARRRALGVIEGEKRTLAIVRTFACQPGSTWKGSLSLTGDAARGAQIGTR